MHVFGPDTDPAEVLRAIEAHEHFWLDLPMESFGPDHPVARALGIGPDKFERLQRRHGRAFAVVDDDHAAIVFAGAVRKEDRIERVEVVTIAHENGLVTLRDRPCGPLDARRDSARDLDALGVVDALTDSLLTIAEQMED